MFGFLNVLWWILFCLLVGIDWCQCVRNWVFMVVEMVIFFGLYFIVGLDLVVKVIVLWVFISGVFGVEGLGEINLMLVILRGVILLRLSVFVYVCVWVMVIFMVWVVMLCLRFVCVFGVRCQLIQLILMLFQGEMLDIQRDSLEVFENVVVKLMLVQQIGVRCLFLLF